MSSFKLSETIPVQYNELSEYFLDYIYYFFCACSLEASLEWCFLFQYDVN